MSTPLKTGEESVYRSHPYPAMEIAEFSGANPDASDASRPVGAFKELHNMRFETPGSPTTRTGFRKYIYGGLPI